MLSDLAALVVVAQHRHVTPKLLRPGRDAPAPLVPIEIAVARRELFEVVILEEADVVSSLI